MEKNKILVLFDFDFTISNVDSFIKIFDLVKDPEKKKQVWDLFNQMDWYNCYKDIFIELKKYGCTLNEIKDKFSSVPMTNGMDKLLNFLKNNKDNYSSFILSANMDTIIQSYLKTNNCDNIFEKIIAYPSKELIDENTYQIELMNYPNECDLCHKNICKSYEAQKLIEEFHPKKIVFICDGNNDYCLVRNLKENDTVFIRKNYGLYKKLYENGFINKIKCNVIAWESADEIIKHL